MRKGSGPYFAGRNSTIEDGMEPVPAESLGYLTDEFTDRAVEFIDRHQDDPFFLFLSLTTPHTPMHAPVALLEEEEGRFETQVRTRYAAMMRSLDESVGRVISALDERGIRDNTFVVYANDNGGAMPFNGSLNAPLRGAKGTALEGGNRVAYTMSWPGTLPEGQVFHEPVSTLDIVPSFMQAAGLDLPSDRTFDGVDLLPYLTGDEIGVPHDTLFWKMQWGAAVRAGKWKLVRTPSEKHWLFDLSTDVSESNDLAEQFPDIVRQLRASLESWESDHPAPIWLIDDGWHARTLERYDQTVVDGFVRN